MVVIVCDNGNGDGQIERQDKQRPVETEGPLNKKQSRCKQEISEGFEVG